MKKKGWNQHLAAKDSFILQSLQRVAEVEIISFFPLWIEPIEPWSYTFLCWPPLGRRMFTAKLIYPRFLKKSMSEYFCTHSSSFFPFLFLFSQSQRVLIERRPPVDLLWNCYLADFCPSPPTSFSTFLQESDRAAVVGALRFHASLYLHTSFPPVLFAKPTSERDVCTHAWVCMGMLILGLFRNAFKKGGRGVPSSYFNRPKCFKPPSFNWSHVLLKREFQTLLDFPHLAESRAAVGLGGSSLDHILEHCWLKKKRELAKKASTVQLPELQTGLTPL